MPRGDFGMVNSAFELPAIGSSGILDVRGHLSALAERDRGISALAQTIIGGNSTILTNLCEEDARGCF